MTIHKLSILLIYLPSVYLLAHNYEAVWRFHLFDLVFTLVLF